MKNKTEIKKSLSKRKYTKGDLNYLANLNRGEKHHVWGGPSQDEKRQDTLLNRSWSNDYTFGVQTAMVLSSLPLRSVYLLNRRFVEKNGLEIKNKKDLVNKNEYDELDEKTKNYVYLILFKNFNEIQKCTTDRYRKIQNDDVCEPIKENVYFPVSLAGPGDSNDILFIIDEKGLVEQNYFRYKKKDWWWSVEILGNTFKVTYDEDGNLQYDGTKDKDGNLMPIEKIVRFSSRYFTPLKI